MTKLTDVELAEIRERYDEIQEKVAGNQDPRLIECLNVIRDVPKLLDEVERLQKERDKWKDYAKRVGDIRKECDEWKQRYADLSQEKNRYYRMYRETVNTLQEVKEKASLTVEGWAADHQACDNEIEEWKAKAEYWKANKHSERDQWKRIAEEYQQKCYDAEKQRDEWKRRSNDFEGLVYKTERQRDEWKAKAERLEKENEGLNKEIGMYTNKLFDIAQSCYKNGDEARELIAKMLK